MENKQTAGYVDASYLQQVLAVVGPVKQRINALLSLQPGQSVVDVGCGPGIDTMVLGQLVGERGRVAGVDHDAEMVATANTQAQALAMDRWVTHRQGSADKLPFGDSEFGASRSERLFQHLREPMTALREMIRVTRPGGRIVVADTDHASLSVDGPNLELWEIYRRYYVARLANGTSGRRLWGMFRRAGVSDVNVEVVPMFVTDVGVADAMIMLDAILREAVDKGAITRDAGKRIGDGWRSAQGLGEFFGSVNVVIVSGVKVSE
jgi:ubiquinone/menaquinone biosynthesis C-methylase UbiE